MQILRRSVVVLWFDRGFMYDYFIGKIADIGVTDLVIERSGIGYVMTASKYCLNSLKLGETAKLFAYLSANENGVSLYGFCSKEEKAMFMRLISINGIGPKAAIGILSGLKLSELTFCIVNGDYKSLSSIKGIGKKTAERIILELKDKLDEELQEIDGSMSTSNASDLKSDAVDALVALGFNKQEAASAVKKVDSTGKTVEEIVMLALKRS